MAYKSEWANCKESERGEATGIIEATGIKIRGCNFLFSVFAFVCRFHCVSSLRMKSILIYGQKTREQSKRNDTNGK